MNGKNSNINVHCKYAIRGFKSHVPSSVAVSVGDVLFFCGVAALIDLK